MKKWSITLFSLLVLISSPVLAQDEPIRIVVFGDSLTANVQLAEELSFPKVLEQKLQSEGYYAQVISMSKPGETTTSATQRIKELLEHRPDIVILQLGYNDALREIDPVNVMRQNLHKITSTLHHHKIGTILAGTKLPEGTSKRYNAKYKTLYYALTANELARSYPDILKDVHNRPDLTLADGVHPNEKGVLTMVHNIYPHVTPLVQWRIELQKFHKENM